MPIVAYKNIEMSNTCFINFEGNIISHILSVHLHISKQNTALIWSKHHVLMANILIRHLKDLVTYLTAWYHKT